jgi:penicillin-binding protein 1A
LILQIFTVMLIIVRFFLCTGIRGELMVEPTDKPTGKSTDTSTVKLTDKSKDKMGKGFMLSGGTGVFFFTLLIAFFLGYIVVAMSLPAIPAWTSADLATAFNTIIYDRDGRVIAVLKGVEDRLPLPGELPQVVKDAFVATEDVRFYRHMGVDPEAVVRAMVANFREGRIVEGASTITQQLIKNSLLTPEKTYNRKIKEVLLALELEKKYSKEEILNMYLTRIYFGHGAYGLEAAARTYFGKTAKDLNLPEAAVLAGLPKAPNRYSPFREPEEARQRMETVLSLMEENEFITKEQEEQAKLDGCKLASTPLNNPYEYPYYVDAVVDEAGKRLGISEKEVYGGGLRIYTALDSKVQQAAQTVWSYNYNFPSTGPDKLPVQGAVAVLDYHNGEIKALVGGRGYDVKRGFNRAVDSRRQPGSTFKPIAVYGPALEAKYPPYMLLDDFSVRFGKYAPENYSSGSRGYMTMASALKYSVNICAVKLLAKIGVETGYNFACKLGFELVPSDKVLPLALGGLTHGVSPLQMASAYGAFANQGIQVEPHAIVKITDYSGAVVFDDLPKASKVMHSHTAAVMTEMLQEVVRGGTGTRARLDRPVAGKTGTTQLPDSPEFKKISGNKDAWFVGYTPELVAAVWIGYDRTDTAHYLRGVVGGSYPAVLWKKVMEQALAGVPKKSFPKYQGKFIYRKDIRVWDSLSPEELARQSGQGEGVSPGSKGQQTPGGGKPTGEQNTTGANGSTGNTGTPDNTGTPGNSGNAGTIGSPGSPGSPGNSGTDGGTGNAGDIVSPGSGVGGSTGGKVPNDSGSTDPTGVTDPLGSPGGINSDTTPPLSGSTDGNLPNDRDKDKGRRHGRP